MDCSSLIAEAKPARDVLARPRSHNFRWCIMGVISVVVVSTDLDRSNLSVAAPLIIHDLSIRNTSMGLVLSAFVCPYTLMNLPAGWTIDRFGPKLLSVEWAARTLIGDRVRHTSAPENPCLTLARHKNGQRS